MMKIDHNRSSKIYNHQKILILDTRNSLKIKKILIIFLGLPTKITHRLKTMIKQNKICKDLFRNLKELKNKVIKV